MFVTFYQYLTCLKPDLEQSESGTSQAICYKIQTARYIAIRTVQNPYSTGQLLHEYRLPEKPEILSNSKILSLLDMLLALESLPLRYQ